MSSPRPGRPRKNSALRDGNGTDEQIADAAAELFSTQGFAGTSMNQIARAVGVGQNSIYHHFGSKLGLLEVLLFEGIRPGLAIARALRDDRDSTMEGIAGRLYALAIADASVMAEWRWNLGALLLLPEVRRPELFEFQAQRRELRAHYVAMSGALTERTGIEDVGDQVLRLVVSIINQRLDDEVRSDTPRKLARSGLRICGWAEPMSKVEEYGHDLLDALRELGVDVPELARVCSD